MLVAVAILSIIGTSFYAIFQGSLVSSNKGMNLAVVSSNLRAVMDYVIKDLKNAVDPESAGRGSFFFLGGESAYAVNGEYPYSYMEFVVPDRDSGGYDVVIYAHYRETTGTRGRNVIFRYTKSLDAFSSMYPRFPHDISWRNSELAIHISGVKFYFGDGQNRLISWGYSTPPSIYVRVDSNDKESNRYRLPVYVNIKLTSTYGKEEMGQQKEVVLEDTIYLKK